MAQPISNEHFLRTFVLKPSDEPEFCREYFEEFRKDAEGAGIIIMGEGEAPRKASEIIDPFIFLPGAGMPPGRCIWLKNPALLADTILEAYQGQFTNPLDQCACLFLSKDKSRLSDVIKTDETIDDFLVILKFMQANHSKTIS